MKIRCIIVDDDDGQIEVLERELNKHTDLCVVKKFNEPNIFLNHQPDIEYDVVFLDIQMPYLNGIEVSEKIRKSVVFVSAYRKDFSENLLDHHNSSPNVIGFIDKANLLAQLPGVVTKLKRYFDGKSENVGFNFDDGYRVIKKSSISMITVQPNGYFERRDKRILFKENSKLTWLTIKNYKMDKVFELVGKDDFFKINDSCIISKHEAQIAQYYTDHIVLKIPKDYIENKGVQSIALNERKNFKSWLSR